MATSTAGTARQFLRYSELQVSSSQTNQVIVLSASNLPAQPGLDASGLRFRFETNAADVSKPNTATIRVYNLSDDTRNTVLGATFDTVTLFAGYVQGTQGQIFTGQIKRFFFGRERNVDSFLEIVAGDGDKAFNESTVSQTFPPGTSDSQQLAFYAKTMQIPVSSGTDDLLSAGGTFLDPRGKVAFGLSRDGLDEIAQTNACRWSIQNGVLTLIPNTGYLPGQTIEISSSTGMIGVPESTEQGIIVRCLLNPLIHIGRLVHIVASDLNQYKLLSHFDNVNYGSQFYPATVTGKGMYRVLVISHQGDTRGTDWFTELTCLAVDPSASSSTSVAPA